jgi:exonuclease SbcD
MRFIHTADWHLGRLFHGVHLTADQEFALRQLIQLVRDAKPDALIIAGDVYDRPVPPPDAVKLLDDVLSELVLDVGVPVLLIAGNHDSPGRLNFGKRLLAGRKLYVSGVVTHPCEPLVLNDAHGAVEFFALPYAEPGMVRECLGCAEVVDHDSAMKHALEAIRSRNGHDTRKVLVAHAFVAGGAECESERPLSVGGAGTVDPAHFAGFDYVALGHLHAPQIIRAAGEGQFVRYSGSLLKYSFDEADQRKAVYVVEMDAQGRCTCESVPLTPRRDVRRVRGLMADVLQLPRSEDYIEVILQDDGPVLDAVVKLREVFPNVLHLRREAKETSANGAPERPKIDARRHRELFKGFFAHATGEELSAEQEAAYVAVAEGLLADERQESCK